MEYSNRDKTLHGHESHQSLDMIIQHNKSLHYILEYTPNYRVGKPGYSNISQFYAPFLITFPDGFQWALFTTTSFRSDRLKGQQWDAVNLRVINNKIERVFLVYSDGIKEKEKKSFQQQNLKIQNGEDFSAIDAVVSQNEISNMIEKRSLQDSNPGKQKALEGKNFETRISNILSYANNLEKWKYNDKTIEGLHYDFYKKIVDCFNLEKSKVYSVTATSDSKVIGKLPSKGNPKTDVIVDVVYTDKTHDYYTISCKRTSSKSVSVHEYKASDFSKILDPDNLHLASLLSDFQRVGGIEAFGAKKADELESELVPYIQKLTKWVLGGQYGEGDPKTQWADYILTYDNNSNDIAVHTIEDYCKILIHSEKKQFGTPFSWTYCHGKKGVSIQLKCRILK